MTRRLNGFVWALALGCTGQVMLAGSLALVVFVDGYDLRPIVGPETPIAIVSVLLFLLGMFAWLISVVRLVLGRAVRAEKWLMAAWLLLWFPLLFMSSYV